MKVRAIQFGVTKGGRVYPGQVFEVPDGTKGKWFVPAEQYKEPEKTPEPEVKTRRRRKVEEAPISFRDMAERDTEAVE